MSGKVFLYLLCLLVTTPCLLTARSKTWSNKSQTETSSSYETLEILPYITSKLADRTNVMTEKIDDRDKDKLLTLFNKTEKEVKDAEAFLSDVLRALQSLFAKKPQDNGKPESKQPNAQNIAWSYYDDLGK